MSGLDELRHVADLVGIATRHVDALGIVHEPDEETLARLIAAFGLPRDPRQARDMLAEQELAAPFGLAPLEIVAAEDTTPALHLRLPVGAGNAEWSCCLENGGEHRGRSEGDRLVLPDGLPLGYHRLHLAAASAAVEIDLVVAPDACHLQPELRQGARSWGLAAQLYGLRRRHDWGIGDFAALATLSGRAGALGAATVGINPLHALFAAEPRHFSPYSPSSRIWLDFLYIDVATVPGFAEDRAARALAPDAALAPLRQTPLVDYAAVAAAKRPVLEALFHRLRHDAPDGAAANELAAFTAAGGAGLRQFCVFEALHEHFLVAGGKFAWRDWPPAMRDPASPEVAEFARVNAERVAFFSFLQWQADRQLAAAAASGRAGGLSIGLYRDLAIGVNPNGADAWSDQELVVPDAAIGAPPDPLSRAGQNWGLAPINPLALRRQRYTPLIAALRANMRHAGILRIDHVMGLQRLYWVPHDMPATAGAYVNNPFRELLRLLALESHRQGCAVIGEDLGTVPDGFRDTMMRANVLSYRVVAFERHGDGSFIAPAEYPPLAAASAATHDLATLKGFWLGQDIAWRRRLALYPDATAEATEVGERDRDRHLLFDALVREGLLPHERRGEFLPEGGEPVFTEALGEAIFAYLARSRARMVLVQLEDVAGEAEQANLPGTTEAHPNWRRRLKLPVEDLLAGPAMTRIAARLTAERAAAPRD